MLHLERLRTRIVDLINWMGHTESLHQLSFGTELLRPIPLSCFDIVSCKPRLAQHQRHWLSTPFRSYGGALRVAPESLLEIARGPRESEASEPGSGFYLDRAPALRVRPETSGRIA